MKLLGSILVAAVALEHVWILALETIFWRKPLGRRVFRKSQEFADATAVLAANQGLYNGFLAAGLFWSLLAPETLAGPLRIFFLSCVVVAGIVGGVTVNVRILVAQAGPAAVALVLALAER